MKLMYLTLRNGKTERGVVLMKTVLYPPTIDWDFMFQRPQQIMRQFARHGWKVIFCNKTQIRGKKMQEVEPNLFVCYDLVDFVNEKHTVDVFYSSWARCYDLVHAITADVVVYDRLDDFPEWEQYEHSMLDSSDVVFTTSQILYDKTVKQHHNVHLVRNACDFNHFHHNTKEVPYRHGLKYPVVGFVGALGNWVDKDILDWIAKNYTLLIVGVEFGIKAPKDAIFLGAKPYNDLPVFYNSIDIGIIPFKDNRVANAANPIKMYEYLASGKPVIATYSHETSLYPHQVYTFKSVQELPELINKVLENETEKIKTDRLLIAKSNTWENRFKIVEEEIDRVMRGKR